MTPSAPARRAPPARAAKAPKHGELFRRRYERSATLVTSSLPFDEWTSISGPQRLTGALLGRLTRHVHILEMNGERCRLTASKKAQRRAGSGAKPKPGDLAQPVHFLAIRHDLSPPLTNARSRGRHPLALVLSVSSGHLVPPLQWTRSSCLVPALAGAD
ncbi:MAG: ATP-binding protein [Methylocapsa sp.]|nr:ATP-binding protein [Methylocapsa sp.]